MIGDDARRAEAEADADPEADPDPEREADADGLPVARALRAPAVLLCGHPSAGKSTLAVRTSVALAGAQIPSEILDGDELRRRLPPPLGFSRADRSRQFARALFLAELLAAHGVVPILALVAPFAADRDRGRHRFAPAGWLEVFLEPPEQTCIERDSHGLYARLAAQGGRAAIDAEVFDLYEPPAAPALRLDTHELDVDAAASQVIAALRPLLESAGARGLAPQNSDAPPVDGP